MVRWTVAILSMPLLRRGLWALCLLTAACGGGKTPGRAPDMATADLSTPVISFPADLADTGDLSPPDDLSVPIDLGPPDLLKPPPDLLPPTVTGLPTDCVGTVTADTLYADVVGNNCALDGCHGGVTARYFRIETAAEMGTAWVNQPALGPMSMNFISPFDLDQSFVLYKLTGEQHKVTPFSGGAMPPMGRTPLTHDQLCEFVQWVTQGAM